MSVLSTVFHVRCVGRRVAVHAPFAGIRAIHVLLGDITDFQSVPMYATEVLAQVDDLSRVSNGFLHHVVILVACPDYRAQQTAYLLAKHLKECGAWTTNVSIVEQDNDGAVRAYAL